jgi:hypothetical protein
VFNDDEGRKGRIRKLLDQTEPKKKMRRGISFNGNHNTIVVRGDVMVGHKTANGNGGAKKKPRRNQLWPEEIRAAIRVRALRLQLTEDQVIALSASVLRKFVASLESLNAVELGRVFDSMHNLKRPALD